MKTRKRKYDDSNDLVQNKRPEIDWNQMVSASSVRNYLLNDPILDYYNEYYRNKNPNPKPNPKNIFFSKILEAGIEFERELIEIIKKNHNVVEVAKYYEARDYNKYLETIELMKKGTEIIYQGLLIDIENKTYGLPDLLVKSTYLNKLMGQEIISNEEANIPSTNLNLPYHYVVIDIKHSTIPLRADGIHILNSESIPCYKSQILIYMNILNKILGINKKVAYIWGKKYIWTSCGTKKYNNNFLNKLGIINYKTIDNDYIDKTNKAIEWIRDVRTNGSSWSLEPYPSRIELFPNMKNSMDYPWSYEKAKLNAKIKDITSVWNCGVKNRNIIYKKGIYSWNDRRCNSKNLGFNPGKIASTIDKILEINRQNKVIIRPNKIRYDKSNWYNRDKDILEFYIDFETFNSNFGSIIKNGIISYDSNQIIFMIGIGYMKNNNWSFNTFYIEEKSYEAEEKMIKEWIEWMNKKLIKFGKKNCKLYHWSHAEKSSLNNLWTRNNNLSKIPTDKFIFYDLLKVFTSEPVVIKGALDFSLKSIANSLYEHKLIESHWDKSNPCCNGLNAMTIAQELYLNKKDNEDILNNELFLDIIRYNEIDCKVLENIHRFMRNKL